MGPDYTLSQEKLLTHAHLVVEPSPQPTEVDTGAWLRITQSPCIFTIPTVTRWPPTGWPGRVGSKGLSGLSRNLVRIAEPLHAIKAKDNYTVRTLSRQTRQRLRLPQNKLIAYMYNCE